jgi:drug/metabolite transporter (DMT)-like permease
VLYIASFLIWLVILGRNDLSVAYPIAIGLTLAFSTLAASIVIGEVISPARSLGVLVIFFGIWLVTRDRSYRTSQSAASKRTGQSGNCRATIGIGRGSSREGTRMKSGARDPCQAESR